VKAIGAVLCAVALTVNVLWYVRLTDVIDLGDNAYLLLLPSSATLAAIVVGTAIADRQRTAGVALVAFGAAWTLWVIGLVYDDAALVTTMRACLSLGALLPLVAVLAAADAPRPIWAALLASQAVLTIAVAGVLLTSGAGGIPGSVHAVTGEEFRSAVGVLDNRSLASAFSLVMDVAVAIVSALTTVWVLLASGRADDGYRRHLRLVAVAAVATTVGAGAMAFGLRIAETAPGPGTAGQVARFFAFTLPAVCYLLVAGVFGWLYVVRPVLVPAADGTLDVTSLARASSLDRRVADMLGDPTASVQFLVDRAWVTSSGVPAPPTGEAATTTIEQDGVTIARVVHDSNVPGELATLAAHLAATSVLAERAAVDASMRREVVRRASARLLRAGDTASDELNAALTEGPLTTLRALSTELRAGTVGLDDAATSIRAVAAEVRRISHGIYPPELEQGGLRQALPHGRVPVVRFDPSVELTAYLLAREDEHPTARIVGGWLEVVSDHDVTAHVADRVSLLGGTRRDDIVALPIQAAEA
jgi:hypothetical protein